ncbi:hypothetical protein D915_009646 [Fasciola hepatica]|uniref:Retropepsins domain-containing protein n=1 Tax=Fasciola hepatica TaxID=6192 RepID=A0A4E0RV35_FASHE|nr:hypothetical protein D915_009646 [Fasciola hepatica]
MLLGFPIVPIRLAGKYLEVLTDNGTAHSLIDKAWLGGKWPEGWEPQCIVEIPRGVNGKTSETVDVVTTKLLMGGKSHAHKFVVVREMALSVTIGIDILSVLHCVVSLDRDFLRTPRGAVRFLQKKPYEPVLLHSCQPKVALRESK